MDGQGLDPAAKAAEERAWRKKTAHQRCRRCGALVKVLDGAAFRDDVHFPGIRYKVCDSCGWEQPQTGRRR